LLNMILMIVKKNNNNNNNNSITITSLGNISERRKEKKIERPPRDLNAPKNLEKYARLAKPCLDVKG